MNRKTNVFISIGIVILIVLLGIRLIKSWTEEVMISKPKGSYVSSTSIEESKSNDVFLAVYTCEDFIRPSEHPQEIFSVKQGWLEKNNNDARLFPETSNFDYIFSVTFNRLAENNLHKFRLLKDDELLPTNHTIEHPFGNHQIRFLVSGYTDTFHIEVIERNPKDSIAWLTQKVIDTLHFSLQK